MRTSKLQFCVWLHVRYLRLHHQMLSGKTPLPIKPLEKAADFIKRLPKSAFKEGEPWDASTKEKVALEARQVGMIDCRAGSGGTEKELAQMEKLNHSIFELIEIDADFASQIDPVYVVFHFPRNGRAPSIFLCLYNLL